jgi:hypothetical protein
LALALRDLARRGGCLTGGAALVLVNAEDPRLAVGCGLRCGVGCASGESATGDVIAWPVSLVRLDDERVWELPLAIRCHVGCS